MQKHDVTLPVQRYLGWGVLLFLAIASASAQTTITWDNPAGGNWNDALNWDPQNVPNAPGEEALFPSGGGVYTTILNGGFTIDRILFDNAEATLDLSGQNISFAQPEGLRNAGTLLSSSNYSQLNGYLNNLTSGLFWLQGGGTHYTNYDSLNNDGEIRIGTPGTSAARLYFSNGTRLLTGSGELVLVSGGIPDDATIRPYYGGFTQAAEHTIRGSGVIYSGFTNYGTICADVPSEELWVNTTGRENHGVMQAINDGVLVIGSSSTTQGETGLILADGGEVRLENSSSVSGGTFATSNNGVIHAATSHYLYDFVNDGRVELRGNARTYLGGTTTTNNGTIAINPNQQDEDAILYLYNSPVTIDGIGEITMRTNGDPNDAIITWHYGSFIQGPAHTVRGEGTLATSIENYGTVSADVPDRTLLLTNGTKTNFGLMEARNNGVLQISTTLNQDPGGTVRADGGCVALHGYGTLAGGSVESVNGGVVKAYGSSYVTDITNQGALQLMPGNRLYWGGTESINNGSIIINPDGSDDDAILYGYNSTVTLNGTGEIVLRTGGDLNDAKISWHYGNFINGSEHTIRGEGRIEAGIQNDGLVSADADGLILQLYGGAKTNNGIMQATSGGILDISGSVTQGEDGIFLADNGTVALSGNGQIQYGTLATANGGVVTTQGSNYLTDITNTGDLHILATARTYCAGPTLTNEGTLRINPEQSDEDAILYAFNGEVRIQGAGDILLTTNGSTGDAVLYGHYGSFVQAPEHLIHGEGQISVALKNEGTVRADIAGRELFVTGDGKTNLGVMEAVDGARLRVYGNLDNHGGRCIARDGGEFRAESLNLHWSAYWRRFSGGRWEAYDNSVMRFISVDPLLWNADILLSGENSQVYFDGGTTPTLQNIHTIELDGRFEIAEGRDFNFAGALNNAGHLIVGAACSLSVPGTYTQTGHNPTSLQHDGHGWMTVHGTFVTPDTMRIEGGTLTGAGLIANSVISTGRVDPGEGTGSLQIAGDFRQEAGGDFYVELGGTAEGEYDCLNVMGHAQLAGNIWVRAVNGFTPSVGDTFTVLTCVSNAGTFDFYGCAGTGLGYDVIYEADAVKIVIYEALTSVEEEDPLPGEFELEVPGIQGPGALALRSLMQCPSPTVQLDLPRAADVRVELFDLSGRRVAMIAGGHTLPGTYDYVLTANEGRRLSRGVYLACANVKTAAAQEVRSTRVLVVR